VLSHESACVAGTSQEHHLKSQQLSTAVAVAA